MKKSGMVVLLTLLGLLMSCAINDEKTKESNRIAMQSWIGSTKQQLLLKWGPPTNVYSDGVGGEILCYEQTASTAGYYGQSWYYPPQQILWYRHFFINPSGIIYHARWNE